jgi:hypothetical protein
MKDLNKYIKLAKQNPKVSIGVAIAVIIILFCVL